jgi:archaellum biogenesis ATPase FlaH
MNKYLQDFQSLSSIAISGGRQTGKLTLALYFASQLTKKPVTLISPFSQLFLNKKINANLQLKSNLQPVLKQLIPLNLKDDWKSIKNDYGYSFLLKDIAKINAEAREVVIFHRIDEFFEIQDSNDIENFLFNLISIAQTEEKIIIFTVNMEHESSRYIYDYFEKNIDSEFTISKRAHESNIRDVEIISSLFSPQHSNLSFEFNKTTRSFDLTPTENKEQREYQNKRYRVVLASQSTELIDLAHYLFKGDNFELVQIEPSLTEMMEEILDKTDLIIFNPHSQQLPIELKKITNAISGGSKKVIFIPAKAIKRRIDKAQILQSGFFDIQEKDFYIEDLISSVERALDFPFYTNKMLKIPNKTHLIYDKKIFSQFITLLLSKNIFFTVFQFKYEQPPNEKELKNNLGRAFDIAYINKKDKTLYLFLVNTLTRNASLIEKKFNAISPGIKLIGCKNSSKYDKTKD